MPIITAAPTVDRVALEDIRQALDTAALVRLAKIYADTAPDLCARIHAAQRGGHVTEMLHAAHSLKGGSLQICATRIAEAAAAIEIACLEGRAHDVAAHVVALSEALAATLRDLTAAAETPYEPA